MDKRIQHGERARDGACATCGRRHIHRDDCPTLKRREQHAADSPDADKPPAYGGTYA